MNRVLIVDDEVEMSRLLKMLLELEGFAVESAPNGATALALTEQQAPDVVMVDFHLNDMTGLELISKFREREHLASTPVLVASGKDIEPEARKAGATEFLLKPFEPDELIVALRRLTAAPRA
ncbi:MAG: Regulatory protein AtoC [Anaerolineae bacterium]|nr:MAG: OmpR family two-component response regulator [Chloroflexi bacterium OLB13]MBV6436104.1 Regulatory protein AtoC [Anaerolineae bacterium]